MNKDNGFPCDGADGDGDESADALSADALLEATADALLEEELRQAAAVLDPVPDFLRQLAVEAYALHDLDARIAAEA